MINSKKINKPNLNKIINKNNTNNTNNTGNEKSLRKTDSDFFLTSQKIILTDNKKMNNEKIVINSKNINGQNAIKILSKLRHHFNDETFDLEQKKIYYIL